MLVLLMGGIYEIYRLDGIGWHDAHATFYDDRFRHSSNVEVTYCFYNLRGCNVGITDVRDL
jgi:hypothetical protein